MENSTEVKTNFSKNPTKLNFTCGKLYFPAIIFLETKEVKVNVADVWQKVLKNIEPQVSHGAFITWFQHTKLQVEPDGSVKILTPNIFIVKQLEAHFDGIVKSALKEAGVEATTVEYAVDKNTSTKKRPRSATPEKIQTQTRKTNQNQFTQNFQTGLNTRYTLDSFVIGSNNDLAVSVAKSVIDRPGEKYNPFFLYGGPGLGKTHLVQAIGNELLRRNPKLKILYTPTSRFYSDFINSIKNGKGDEFSTKFRKLDVLIIDDF